MTAIEVLKNVVKKLTLEIKSYELAGRLGYAEAHRKTRRMILAEIQQLENNNFDKVIKRRVNLHQKYVV